VDAFVTGCEVIRQHNEFNTKVLFTGVSSFAVQIFSVHNSVTSGNTLSNMCYLVTLRLCVCVSAKYQGASLITC
jgi:hypothetical protein